MIINRKCEVPTLLKDFVDVYFSNEYKLTTDQIIGKPIRRDGVVVGKMEWADDDYIYGVVFSGNSLFGSNATKSFSYDVEVERK